VGFLGASAFGAEAAPGAMQHLPLEQVQSDLYPSSFLPNILAELTAG